MKLKLNYDAKIPITQHKLESIVGIQGMHQTNTNFGEEYLIPDAMTNGVFGTVNYEWKTNVLQAGLRFDNRQITTEENGTLGEEGYFKAIDVFDSFNASWYKTKLMDAMTLRLNVASGFRAPNLAELTSNGIHEGTNRYEVGK
jgi:iron complex outermembrane receptor protein